MKVDGKTALLTEGAIASQVVWLAFPMLWGLLAISVNIIADTYFVAQLGTLELAALSFIFPIMMVVQSIAVGMGVGASSVIARAIGEGNQRKVSRLTTDSLILSITFVATVIVVGLSTIDPLFNILGAEADVLEEIRGYMHIWYFGMVFVVVPIVGSSAIRATGDTRTPSLIMSGGSAVNIILDPILIFGLLGFPELGLKGAALASVASRATTFTAALLILHFRDRMIDLGWPKFREVVESWKGIIHVGGPAAATTLITPLSLAFITSLMAGFGAEAVAGFGVVSRIETFAIIPFMALAFGVAPFVGQNWGAGAYDRVYKATQYCYLYCMICGVIVALAFAASARPMIALFDDNPAVVDVATTYLFLVPVTYGTFGVMLTASSIFSALGNPLPTVVMTVARTFVLYVPLAHLGAWLYGITGAFAAAAVANICVGAGSYLWSLRLRHPPKPEAERAAVSAGT